MVARLRKAYVAAAVLGNDKPQDLGRAVVCEGGLARSAWECVRTGRGPQIMRDKPERRGPKKTAPKSPTCLASGTNIALAKPRFCLKCFVLTLPRGVTVTQRPLEALFMVRIHAR